MISKNEFISPLSDFVFKRVFGDQKNMDITAAFLKTLLDIPHDEYGKLTVSNPILGGLFKHDKTSIVDLKLTTKSGKIIRIELQVEKKRNLRNRITYYNNRLISDQLNWGDDYDKLHQAISVVICDHILLEEEESYINIYKMQNDKNRPFTNLQKIVILELPKLSVAEDNAVWRWLRFLKCKKKEDYEMLALKYPELEKPIFCARRVSLLEQWREYWFHRNLAKVDERMLHEQWKIDAKLDVARNMLEEGLTIELIQKVTGLPTEELDELTNPDSWTNRLRNRPIDSALD